MNKNRYPSGWTHQKLEKVLRHYEGQSEDEAAAEDDAAFEDRTQAFIEVPRKLVPSVRRLLAKYPA